MRDVALKKAQGNPKHYRSAGPSRLEGTTIEWHDFFLYSTAAALAFNKLFLPLQVTLTAFTVYAEGVAGHLTSTIASIHEERLLAWGWRLPFLTKITLRIFGRLHRASVAKSPDLRKLKRHSLRSQVPPIAVVHSYTQNDDLPACSNSPLPFTSSPHYLVHDSQTWLYERSLNLFINHPQEHTHGRFNS
ncbi:MHS family MFS transporter [Pseudomonas sp. BN417]|uniref:MHS family MFS transporter n=1 Tax=unclassified Pseudomonas TaxID=196821 RepID=UPI000858A8C8|nr:MULTISPECIES: MHS family MFS transporter [unclassified Pseudomonas]AOE86682.1 hypothetical protein THL1_4134 [Pseudomonas sp. TCU-HL1]MDH4555863.1 MHS family MFS transporter [Pseudomonas sp. BN417]